MDLEQYVQSKSRSSIEIDKDLLKKLPSVPHEQLESERSGLRSKLASTLESQQTLARNHANDFVHMRHDMEHLRQLMQSLKRSATDSVELSLAIPRIPEKAYVSLRDILANELVVYGQIEKIQELLSVPELVKDSIMAGNFGTAIDLASMTERLQKRYPNSQIVSQLVEEVRKSVDGMREIFLDSLREASRLPQLTRAVTFLQRLNFSKLDQVYIDSRDYFLRSQWGQIPSQLKQSQPLAYLKRVVEIYREHVFATINGYNTIFNEGGSFTDASEDNEGLLRLAFFSRQALSTLLTLLRTHAPLITDESDRASLWLQLAFCANSLGRIGADFWPFLDSNILSKNEWEEALRHQRDMAGRVSKYSASAK